MTLPEAGAYILAGLALFWKFFDWSVARNVKTADEENKKRDVRIEEQKKEIEELKSGHQNEKNERKQLTEKIDEARGILKEIRDNIELSREKQAKFYREELTKLEHLLRQEMTRAVSDIIARPERTRGRSK